jgi:hypothetical protein
VTSRNERLIKYLGLGFTEFVEDQKNWGQIYFKDQAKDLENKANSGRMMIELNAFIGDVLSFYIEDRFRNSNLVTANDITSIVDIGDSFSFRFVGPAAASNDQNFYLEVPATTGSVGNYIPNMRYAINFKNVQLQNNNGIVFEALSDVDFTKVNISSSLNAKVSARNAAGLPTHFLLKTTAPVMAGKTVTETFTLGEYEEMKTLNLSNKNVLQIIDVIDSDGDAWEEVEHLVQDVVFEGVKNTAADNESVPYVLKIKSVPKRFITRVDPKTGVTRMTFGNGKSSDIGKNIVPDPSLIALDLKGKLTFAPTSIDPQDFLKSRNLGLAPYNTTLTVRARVGGGKITNTAVSSLTTIVSREADFNSSGLSTAEVGRTLSSFSTRNLQPIQGGDDAPTITELKAMISSQHAAQNRVNTREDYIARTMSMPSIFGKVFRVSPTTNYNSQTGVQLYILAKNYQDQITACSDTMKRNIKNYLSMFGRMGQGIDLLDGKIINIGVEYTIVVVPGKNKSVVKVATMNSVKDFFKRTNWQMRQPINLDELRCLIKDIDGVYSISDLKIVNKANIQNDLQYSETVYDISGNTRNNIIFCPANSMFEVKFPDIDIKAGVV